MTNDDKTRDDKVKYGMNGTAAKRSALLLGKREKYE